MLRNRGGAHFLNTVFAYFCLKLCHSLIAAGMEMVEDKESKTPLNGEAMLDIWDATKRAGVLLGKGGFYGNVFRIKPPMCITRENADKAVAVFEEAIVETLKKK